MIRCGDAEESDIRVLLGGQRFEVTGDGLAVGAVSRRSRMGRSHTHLGESLRGVGIDDENVHAAQTEMS